MNSTLTALDNNAGIDISDTSSLDEILARAQFDFETEKVPVFTPEGDEIPNKHLLRRTDNNHILGVVGGKYTPVRTRIMLEPFHELVQEYGATYENAGIIKGGRKCWISATLPTSFSVSGRKGDVINQRVVALMTHDGTGRNSYLSVANRLFCNNQLRLILNNAAKSQYSISHTKNWETQFAYAADGFHNAIEAHVGFEQVVNDLNSIKMTPDEVEVFARHLYKIQDKKVVSPQAITRGERLKELFVRGEGNIGESRWDALNAVTEMLDHHNPRKAKKKSNKNRLFENRFISNTLGGYGDSIKQRAVRLLQDRTLDLRAR